MGQGTPVGDRAIETTMKDEMNAKRQAFERVSGLVDNADRILVAAHKNPDGDAIGSVLAMSGILRLLRKPHTVFVPEGIPQKLRFLEGADRAVRDTGEGSWDLTLLFDTSEASLLPPGFPEAGRRGTLVVIDHHSRCDNMGDLVVRFPSSAVGELLYEMAGHLRWPLDRGVAEALYTTIVADTSSFRYESATPACHKAAADLIALGAEPWRVSCQLFESVPASRQRLLSKVLGTLSIEANGRFARLICTREMLKEADATREDLDGMINFARAVEGVELAALLREETSGDIKLSLRSKGSVDASELAGTFGGGGHRNAGGAYLSGTTIQAAALKVTRRAKQIFQDNDTPSTVVTLPSEDERKRDRGTEEERETPS